MIASVGWPYRDWLHYQRRTITTMGGWLAFRCYMEAHHV